MSPEKQRRTFLSYSRINKDFALRLAKELKADGFLVWLDQLDIPTGARWDDELEKALEESEIFMVILTPASTASDNVKDEIGYAIDTGKRILPILLKDAKVPLRLRRFQYVDFTTKSFDEGIASAKQLLRNLIEEPTIPIPRKEIPADSQDKGSQAKAQETKEIDEEQLAPTKADAEDKAKQDAERIARRKAKSDQLKLEQTNVMKASALLKEGKQLLQNQDWSGATQKFKQVLNLTPNHAETKKLLADAEAQILQERESKEEAERLAKQKAEAEQIAQAKAEAERLAAQKAENERKAKEETERLARLKAEEEKLAKEKQELEKIRLQTQAQAPEPGTIAHKPETKSSPPKKKGLARPLKIGIGVGVSLALVVCAVLGAGMLFGPTDPPISDPPIVGDSPNENEIVNEDPVEIPNTGDEADSQTTVKTANTATLESTNIPPTKRPTQEPTPMPVPQSGDLLYTTTFNDFNHWEVSVKNGNEADYVYKERSDGFYVKVPDDNDYWFAYYNLGEGINDVRIEANVELVGGTNFTYITLTCRSSKKGEYVFDLDTGGYWQIGKWDYEAKSYEQLGYGGSTSIKVAQNPNHISVTCVGDKLNMLINNQEVGSAQDSQFTEGRVGIGVETFDIPLAEVVFHNLEVYVP